MERAFAAWMQTELSHVHRQRPRVVWPSHVRIMELLRENNYTCELSGRRLILPRGPNHEDIEKAAPRLLRMQNGRTFVVSAFVFDIVNADNHLMNVFIDAKNLVMERQARWRWERVLARRQTRRPRR